MVLVKKKNIQSTRYVESGTIDTYKEVVDLMPKEIEPLTVISIGKIEDINLNFKDLYRFITLYDMMDNSIKERFREQIQFIKRIDLLQSVLKDMRCQDSLQLIESFNPNRRDQIIDSKRQTFQNIFRQDVEFKNLEDEIQKLIITELFESLFNLHLGIQTLF